jgi:hypothetical protein
MAVELTLKHFAQFLEGEVVLIRSDNTSTCAYINKQGGTKSWEMCAQACRLWSWCLERDMLLRAVFIPGVSNVSADSLSRGKVLQGPLTGPIDHREWMLNKEVVQSVFLLFGEPLVDLFAARVNAQLPKFCALTVGQQEMATDALSIPWTHLFSYAFPPVIILNRVISKVLRERARMVLIAPQWPERPWFSSLLHMLVEPPVCLPLRQDLLSQGGQLHTNPAFFKLVAWRISGDPLESAEFRRRLSMSRSTRWFHGPGQSTVLSGVRSVIGVVSGTSIPLMHL